MARTPGAETRSAPAGAAVSRDEERMRRRFARRQWARRWGVWRPLLVIVLAAALVGGVVWAVWFSTLFGVDRVKVTGTDHLKPSEVTAVTEVEIGVPLVSVDVAGVRSRVEALAPVRSATVTRHLDGTLAVEVEERRAVAVAVIGGKFSGLDAEGVAFRQYRKAPKGVPQVRTVGSVDREALKEAAGVVAALPADLATDVRWVEVETLDHISLVMKGGRTVLWGSGEGSAEKAQVLAALLKVSKDKRFDVSVPGQPVTSAR